MPYSTEWKEKEFQATFTGIVTSQEILKMVFGFYGDERFDRIKYNLVDFTGADSLKTNEKEIKEIAYLDMAAARSNPNIKVAIAAGHDFIKEMSQLYAEYSDESPWQVKIFNTLEEARQWLGINA